MGGARLARAAGLDRLVKPTQMLVFTFWTATSVKRAMAFHLRVYTEPRDSATKSTRTHHAARGAIVDFGGEQLELDWMGDERGVVVELMQYVNGRSKLLGEVRIDHQQIYTLTREAAVDDSDLRRGARAFFISSLPADRAKLDPVKDFFAKQVRNAVGEREDLARLRDENEHLRTLLDHDPTRHEGALTGAFFARPPLSSYYAEPRRSTLLKVAIRLHLLAKSFEQVDVSKFASSSFHEDYM
eukprot:NODE_2638_length_900_cov_284.897041.p2 GENE.NODE_2638_length_900_cov_284.897041~~NODE_2638_length_900_cov_284.897041.p2  ORF type:complete len:242 (+),score=73.16 NODE_2638_length_900_cov_284.897041:3-728(+)